MLRSSLRLLTAAAIALLVACRVSLPGPALQTDQVHLIDGHLAYGPLALDMEVGTVERLIGRRLALKPNDSEICSGFDDTVRFGAVAIALTFTDTSGRRVLSGIQVPFAPGHRLADVVAAIQRRVPLMEI